MHDRILRDVGGALLLTLFSCALAMGQEFRGAITGTVTDQNGAVVPGATVTVTNVGTNIEGTDVTNGQGSYGFPILLPGKYKLTVTKEGFKVEVREQIEIRVTEKLTIDVQLQTGTVAETVTIVASPVLETGSVTTGTTIERKQISELPLSEGTAYQLATLAPGVAYTGNPMFTAPISNGNLAAFRVNGARRKIRLRWMARQTTPLILRWASRRRPMRYRNSRFRRTCLTRSRATQPAATSTLR